MNRERDIMHKILDDAADEEERSKFARKVEADPVLRDEFGGLVNAVRMLEQSERREPPASFTSDVMKRLPRRSPSVLDRVRAFLFGGRVLRWNVASAAAAVLIAAAVLVFLRTQQVKVPATSPVSAGQEVTVRLTFHAPRARSVAVVGEFNKWKTDADPMARTDGAWNITLKLKPGVYSYSFIVDGKTWVADPGAQTYEEDGFGSRNAVLRVSL